MSSKIIKNGTEYRVGVIPQNYPASNIGYNNTSSGLAADDVQGAIDELAQGGGGGGHTIQNESGTDLTQRSTLQFAGYLKTTDDSTNSKTVVDNTPINVTWNEYNALSDAERDGNHYIITGAPGVDPTADTVSVTADGVKTYGELLNDIFLQIDSDKITDNTKLIIENNILSLSWKQSTEYDFYSIATITASNIVELYVALKASSTYFSATNGTPSAKTTQKPANGKVISLHYGTSSQIVNLKTDADNCMMSDGVTSVEDAIDEAIGLASNKAVYNGLFPTFSLSGAQKTKVIDQDITLTEEHVILITLATYVAKANNGSFYIPLEIDNVDYGNIILLSQTISTFISTSYAAKLSAGAHNIKLFVATDSASSTASNESFRRGMYTIAVL